MPRLPKTPLRRLLPGSSAGRLALASAGLALLSGCLMTTPETVPPDPGHQAIVIPGPVSDAFNVTNAKPLPMPTPPELSALPAAPAPASSSPVLPDPLPQPAPATLDAPNAPPEPSIAPPASPIPTPTAAPATASAPPPPVSTSPVPVPPVSAPAAPPTELAALPPAAAEPPRPRSPAEEAALKAAVSKLTGHSYRLVFEPESLELPRTPEALATLGDLARLLKVAERARIRLQSYASGDAEQPVAARQKALARADAVRDYLISQGVRRARIDIRALGLVPAQAAPADRPGEAGPADRVDLLPLP